MKTELDYEQTLEYLYSFVDYSLTHDLQNLPEKFDLERMRQFMGYLGNPHENYPIIHIAGTKGKGSVCAFCASALQAAGFRTGLYTSPHLQDYAERIQIDGQPIAHSELISLVNEIRPLLDQGTKLTTFEITTALAFLYFSRKEATAVVAEVGLGGRLDATNIVNPVVSVITSISYDHMQVLGSTLTEIAAEKGGIIKPGVPVVVAPQPEEAQIVFERLSLQRNAPLIQVGEDYQYIQQKKSLDGQSMQIWKSDDNRIPKKVRLNVPLLGTHQIDNAATAFAALSVANARGLAISKKSIQGGFNKVFWPGRFEVLRKKPPVVIDSAHNPDSAQRLNQTLEEYFPDYPVIMVFGASEDKDIQGMLAVLIKRVKLVIFTRSYHPRAADPNQLIKMVEVYEKHAIVISAVEDALEEAIRQAGDDSLILVAGSIFIAAGARHSWYNRKSKHSS